jgi:hypothetical protein
MSVSRKNRATRKNRASRKDRKNRASRKNNNANVLMGGKRRRSRRGRKGSRKSGRRTRRNYMVYFSHPELDNPALRVRRRATYSS